MAISIEFKPIYYDILQMLAINYRNETIFHKCTLNIRSWISLYITPHRCPFLQIGRDMNTIDVSNTLNYSDVVK